MAINLQDADSGKKKIKPRVIRPKVSIAKPDDLINQPIQTAKAPIIPTIPKQAPIVEAAIESTPTIETALSPPVNELIPTQAPPVVTQGATQAPVAVGPTPEELNARLIAVSKQNAIDSLNKQFATKTGRLDQEEAAIAGNFRTAEGNVRTRDTMARAGADKFLNIGGLGQAGQVGQSSTAQNVITQGASSQLAQQELGQRADIERRRTELVNDRAQGISDINTEIEIQQIESQLRSAESQAAYEQEKAKLAESREYDDYLRILEKADAREVAIFEQQLVERNNEIDFAIEEARANNDLVREKELTATKAANDLQIEGIKQAGRLQLEGARSANTLNEIGARGAEARNTEQFKQSLEEEVSAESGQPVNTIKGFIENSIQRKLTEAKDAQTLVDRENKVNPFSVDQEKQLVMSEIILNPDWFGNDVNKLREILDTYGISEAELEAREDQIFQLSPSVGS